MGRTSLLTAFTLDDLYMSGIFKKETVKYLAPQCGEPELGMRTSTYPDQGGRDEDFKRDTADRRAG